MNCSTLKQAALELSKLYPQAKGSFEMEMFLSKEYGAIYANRHLTTFLKDANFLDQLSKKLSNKTLSSNTAKRALAGFVNTIPIKFGNEWVHMDAGELVLYHVTLIHQQTFPVPIETSNYGLKAFE